MPLNTPNTPDPLSPSTQVVGRLYEVSEKLKDLLGIEYAWKEPLEDLQREIELERLLLLFPFHSYRRSRYSFEEVEGIIGHLFARNPKVKQKWEALESKIPSDVRSRAFLELFAPLVFESGNMREIEVQVLTETFSLHEKEDFDKNLKLIKEYSTIKLHCSPNWNTLGESEWRQLSESMGQVRNLDLKGSLREVPQKTLQDFFSQCRGLKAIVFHFDDLELASPEDLQCIFKNLNHISYLRISGTRADKLAIFSPEKCQAIFGNLTNLKVLSIDYLNLEGLTKAQWHAIRDPLQNLKKFMLYGACCQDLSHNTAQEIFSSLAGIEHLRILESRGPTAPPKSFVNWHKNHQMKTPIIFDEYWLTLIPQHDWWKVTEPLIASQELDTSGFRKDSLQHLHPPTPNQRIFEKIKSKWKKI